MLGGFGGGIHDKLFIIIIGSQGGSFVPQCGITSAIFFQHILQNI